MYYLQHKYRVFGNDKWLKSILGESLANPENPTSWDPAYKGILSISYWELKKLLTNGENQTSGMEELEKLIKKGYWVTFPKTIKDKDVNLELKSKYLNRTFCLPLRLSFAYCKSIGDKSIVKLTKRYPNLAGIDLCGCRRVTNVSIKAIEENCKHMKCIFTYATKTSNEMKETLRKAIPGVKIDGK
jgi:hypothetical protein